MKRFKIPTRLPLHKPLRITNLENAKLIRDVIYNFYINEKRPPTLAYLMANIKKDNLPFYGCKTTLRYFMRQLGFRWTATTNDRVLIESDEIRYKRINYLKKILEYRELEKPIIYLYERSIDNSYLRKLQRPEGGTNDLSKLNHYNLHLIVIYALMFSSSSPSSASSLPRRFLTVRKYGKPLPAPAREVVANIRNFLRTESVITPKIPLQSYRQRTIEATGVTKSVYKSIMKDVDMILRGEMKDFKTPTRRPPRPSQPSSLRIMNLESTKSIRDIIYNFYVNEKRPPTIRSLMANIERDSIPFYGCKTTLWRFMRKLGFRWQRTNDRLLIESDEIRCERINYLKQILEYRELERPIIYLNKHSVDNSYLRQLELLKSHTSDLSKLNHYNRDLIVIYAGGEMGVLPNSLLVSMPEWRTAYNFNSDRSKIFSKWFETQLLPILPPKSVLIIDNNIYQSINIEDAISTKTDMIEWLQKRNLTYNVGMTKAELYAIIKSYKSENPTCKLDELLKKYGCSALRLPPHHPELSPAGLVWNNIKDCIVTQRIHQMKEIKDLLQEKFDLITTQNDWRQFCDRIKIVEKEYLERENVFDKITDDLEIILQHHNDDCEEDNEVIDETMEIEELSDNEFEENHCSENTKIKSETIESIRIKQEQFSDDEMNNWKSANFVQIKNEVHSET